MSSAPCWGSVSSAISPYHSIEGDRGLVAYLRLTEQIQPARSQLTEVVAQRKALEQRVGLLRPNQLDPDMLDERARLLLNLARPDEIVIPDPARRRRRAERISRAPHGAIFVKSAPPISLVLKRPSAQAKWFGGSETRSRCCERLLGLRPCPRPNLINRVIIFQECAAPSMECFICLTRFQLINFFIIVFS